MERRLALGIDLGTTNIKISLRDITTDEKVFAISRPSDAWVESDIGPPGMEQSPGVILSVLEECVQAIPVILQKEVAGIAVTGQTEGLVMWETGQGCKLDHPSGRLVAGSSSHLYTWLDGRCSLEFLASLPQPDSHLALHSGRGWVTLLWVLQHRPDMIMDHGYDSAGTIIDYVVTGLCDLEKPVTSEILASSMGYFNTVTKTWNTDILKSAGFPTNMLPSLAPLGSVVGYLQCPWGEIREGVPIYVGMGDTQCAFHSLSLAGTDAVFNIGTSLQMGYIITDPHFYPFQRQPDTPPGVIYHPYFNGSYIALYNSRNGGNVLEEFVKMIHRWCRDVGADILEKDVWTKLTELSSNELNSDLKIDPTLFGTLDNPSPYCNVREITPTSMSLGQVFQALCYSIVDMVHSELDSSFLQNQGITTIRTTGPVISAIPSFIRRLEQRYHLHTFDHGTSTDAAFGAARVVV